jgi:hypothetical protein
MLLNLYSEIIETNMHKILTMQMFHNMFLFLIIDASNMTAHLYSGMP